MVMKKTIGENLKRFRLKNNLSLAAAGELLDLSAPGLLKYERNKILPNLERLEKFAEVYHISIDDILDTGSTNDIKFNNFKCISRTSSIDQEKIKSIIRKRIDNYFALLELSEIKLQNKFGVHMISTLEEAESLATKLRIFFTIPIDAPIANLIYLLESNGMIIMTIPVDEVTKHFVGFYENINNVPIIIVPEADNGYNQRFSIAKYLGELLIVANNNKDAITTRFAESLLIPKQALHNEFGNFRTNIEFKELEIFSSIYKVSYKNIIKRLLYAEIITPSNAKYTNIYINKNNIKEQTYYEEAHNYDKMLYKLKALGQIKDISKYQ